MANNFIELIYSKSAVKEAEQVLQTLSKTHEEILKLSKVNLDFYGGTTPKNPQQLKNIIADVEKLEKAQTQATNKLVKDLERQRLAEIKLQQEREKAFDKYEAQLSKEQAKLNASLNLYNSVQNKIRTLTSEYNNLAVKKELGISLTDKESNRLQFLTSKISNYNNILKGVDATVGKHQRNVGNYATANSQLSNSMHQIVREAPAAGNGLQTFFMAISNNAPIAMDAIKNTIAVNKELQAQGQPTVSVLKQIGQSLLSFNSLLSIGSLVLILYAKDIQEWSKSLFGASAALNELNDRQKEFNKTRIEGKKNAQEDILNLRKYLSVAKDVNANEDFRNEAVKNLRQNYYYYFKNLTDAQIKNGQYGESVKELTKALERKGQIELATSLNVTNKQKLIDLEEERTKLLQLEKITDKRLKSAFKNGVSAQALATISDELNRVQTKRIKIDQEIIKYQNAIRKNDEIIFDLKEKTIGLEINQENERKKAHQAHLKRQDVEILGGEIQQENANSLLVKLENEKQQLIELQKTVSKNNAEWRMYQKTIDFVQKTIDTLTNTNDELAESGKRTADSLKKQGEEARKAAESQRKLEEETRQFIRSLGSDFLNNSGAGSLNFFMTIQSNGLTAFEELMAGADTLGDKFAVTFSGIANVAKDAFNFINQQSEANYQRELSRLESQKELAIKYAGDSTTAKEEIERQYEQRRRQLERQKAEQEKQKAIFNIIIDTAQAVVGALAEQNYAGAIAFGLLGAAQLAIVNSQQVPAYADGTENHKGGLMLVNDAKGSNYQETVITPDGKTYKPKGRNVLMNAPNGTKVKTAEWTESLNNILHEAGINGISTPIYDKVSNTLTANELDNVMGKYFANIQTNHTIMDANGITNYMVKNGQKTTRLDNRVSFKGYRV